MTWFVLKNSRRAIQNELHLVLRNVVPENEPSAVVDAGAWLGDHAIPMAEGFPELTVYAIEPSARNAVYIRERGIALPNLRVMSFLLGREQGQGSVIANEDRPNARYALKGVPRAGSIPVHTVDGLVDSGTIKESIRLLHFDVEGSELDDLRGSLRTIQSQKPVVLVETLGDELSAIEDFFQNEVKAAYARLTVDESCKAFDLWDASYCRNHFFVPQALLAQMKEGVKPNERPGASG